MGFFIRKHSLDWWMKLLQYKTVSDPEIAQTAPGNGIFKPKSRAILGIMRLNFLSETRLYEP